MTLLTANQRRLLQAAEAVLEEKPGMVSDQVRKTAQEVAGSLRGEHADQGELSPGMKAVKGITGKDPQVMSPNPNDGISPGQREAYAAAGNEQ